MLSYKKFLNESSLLKLGKWLRVSDRLGSNPGGVFRDPETGEERYAKFYDNPEQAKVEVATARAYDQLGVPNLSPDLGDYNDKLSVHTKWNPSLQKVNPNYSEWDSEDQDQLAKHFGAAVTTKNWDAIGLEHDNIMRQDKKLVNVDLGGSMDFRARGSPKPFGVDIDEYDTLREPHIPAGEAFGILEPERIRRAVKDMNLDTDELRRQFRDIGVSNPDQRVDTLAARLDLLKRR